jgi:hypothetical protein
MKPYLSLADLSNGGGVEEHIFGRCLFLVFLVALHWVLPDFCSPGWRFLILLSLFVSGLACFFPRAHSRADLACH